MELYILDELLRRIQVLDDYQSFIWTERFSENGDIEFVISSTPITRALLVPGTLLATNVSYYVMKIEEAESKVNDDGLAVLTITGPSLESVTKDRVAKLSMGDLTEDPAWVITAPPADVIRTVFKEICIDGTLDLADIIPYIQEGDFLFTPGSWGALDDDLEWYDNSDTLYWEDVAYSYTPEEDLSEPISVSITPTSVYDVIKSIADSYNLGFRLVRNFDNSELYFDVYSGIDRTSLQSALPPVKFSSDLDNLSDTTEYTSKTGSKNVAYVFSENGSMIVYAEDVETSIAGFERRVMYVDASDITEPAGSTLDALLQQRGYEELAKNRSFTAFDGEINEFGSYKYGVDFNLGDLVEMKNSNGVTSKMRVTEQIFVSDAEGYRSYPTLVEEITIIPGSWYALSDSLVWDDIPDDTDHEWEDY